MDRLAFPGENFGRTARRAHLVVDGVRGNAQQHCVIPR
jgi:hypothetical protein